MQNMTPQEIKNLILQFKDDEEYTLKHLERFVESWLAIEPLLKPGMVVLDLGSDGYGHMGHLIRTLAPDVSICSDTLYGEFDFRHPVPIPENQYDLVLCMEVLEHINDPEPKTVHEAAEFRKAGAYSLMREIKRILKPGGKLFLTTPNINRWGAIHALLTYYDPKFYKPHIHEWSIRDIGLLMADTNFRVDSMDTKDVLVLANGRPDYFAKFQAAMEFFCMDNDFSTKHRGEDIFLTATVIK